MKEATLKNGTFDSNTLNPSIQGCFGKFAINNNLMKIDEKPFEIKAGCKEPEECTKDFCKNGGVCQQDRINYQIIVYNL